MPRHSATARTPSRPVAARAPIARGYLLADLHATVAFLLTLAHLNVVAAPSSWWRSSATAPDVVITSACSQLADSSRWGAAPAGSPRRTGDLCRVTQVDYQYASGDDPWTDPFDAEDTRADPDPDPRRAAPSPHVAFDKRVQRQTFQYDWLGNTSRTDDDAHGFYDRSLGTITNNTAGGKPYQLTAASNTSLGGQRKGALSATYDPAGNLTGLTVQRSGPCLPTGAGCSQTYAYEWDEVGRLARAERWDTATPGVNDPAAADLRYAYDANDARVLKTALDAASNERHTLYVFPTLELRRAAWDSSAEAYTRDALSEVPYLMAHGVRLARVVYEPGDKGVPEIGASGGHTHVFFELGDHLGSTSTVLDQATGELVEKGTYQAYGGAESDYRAGRWKEFREDYRFTGKEEDAEVGLAYFGARYYAPLLGRWVSADPLTVHGAGGDLNGYAYVHGAALRAVDATGLDANGAQGASGDDNQQAQIDSQQQKPVDTCSACMSMTPEDSARGYRENAATKAAEERTAQKTVAACVGTAACVGVTVATGNPAAGALAGAATYSALGGVASEEDVPDLVPMLAPGVKGASPAAKAGTAVVRVESGVATATAAESTVVVPGRVEVAAAAGDSGALRTTGEFVAAVKQAEAGSAEAAAMGVPAPGSLTNEATRHWYHAQLDAIPSRIDPRLPLRDRALQAFGMRNEMKLQARSLMADRAAAESLPAPSTLQDVVRRAYDQGLRGDDVWRYVLGGSQRSNAAVDAALGISR